VTVRRVVVAGNGLAGLRTAEWLHRNGFDGQVTVVGDETHPAYNRPPLSKAALLAPEDCEPQLLRPLERYDELPWTFRTGVRATGLDLADHTLALSDGTSEPWDRLVIATGVRPRSVGAWAHHERVHLLRTIDDARRLRSALRSSTSVAVVGGGVLGCEIAASARSLGLAVTLVEPLDHLVGRAFGPRIGALVADRHRDAGVQVLLNRAVATVAERADGLDVVLTDGTTVQADVVVVAIGTVPDVDWLAGSGLVLDGGVACDSTYTTSADDVLVAGDVAAVADVAGARRRMEHWTHAGESAALVADNLLLERSRRQPLAAVPYVWSDQYGAKLQVLGRPTPDDEVILVDEDGALGFLGVHVRAGRVTAVSGSQRVAQVMRCRTLVAERWTREQALADMPWIAPSPTPSVAR
jgi:3-phenylpropionate/trans-cinnamate dioxygenase ferredoxin reductase subunit